MTFDRITGNQKQAQQFAPDHDRITRGVPFSGPAEGPCPAPVPAREWTPERTEIYPNGKWELVNFVTGNADDGRGGALRCWVHETYLARCRDRRYQRSSVTDQFGGM